MRVAPSISHRLVVAESSVLLAGEVGIQRAGAEAGRFSDIVYRSARIAIVCEHFCRGVEQQ